MTLLQAERPRTRSVSRSDFAPFIRPRQPTGWDYSVVQATEWSREDTPARILDFPLPIERHFEARSTSNLRDAAPQTVHRAAVLLKSISSVDTYFPSVDVDEDGGVILFWKAGVASLQIDLSPDGSYFVREFDSEAGIDQVWYEGEIPVSDLRRALTRLTNYVEATYPAWRDLFLK